jgi:thioredoxin 1
MLEVKKFYGTWCGPCKMLAPTIEKLKKEHTDVRFTDIDVDQDFEAASKYVVRSIPLVVIERDGQEVQRFSGLQSEMAYNNAINELKRAV